MGSSANRFPDCRLLVVDDDQDFTVLVRRGLSKLGISEGQVRACSDGHAAIKFLSKGDWVPSLMLLDHKMPAATGLEVLEWLQSRESYASLPVFMISTGTEPELVKKAYQLGAEAYFIKPLEFARLQEHIVQILDYWKTGTRSRKVPGSVRPDAFF